MVWKKEEGIFGMENLMVIFIMERIYFLIDIIRDLSSLVIILSREDLYHYVMQNVYDYNFKEKERECFIGKSN